MSTITTEAQDLAAELAATKNVVDALESQREQMIQQLAVCRRTNARLTAELRRLGAAAQETLTMRPAGTLLTESEKAIDGFWRGLIESAVAKTLNE